MNKQVKCVAGMGMLLSFLLLHSGLSAQLKKYKIVYNVLYDTSSFNYEIMVTDPDGKEHTNITNYKGMDWTYASRNSYVYFISDRDTACKGCYKLYAMGSDGSAVRKISDLVLEDSWMDIDPSGKTMIVAGRVGRSVRAQLFLMNLADGSFRQLTHDTAAYYADPVFSPDGNQIAFRYKSNRRDRSQKAEIYIANADMSGMRQLTVYPADDTTAQTGEYHAGPPKWNARRNFISYISFRQGRYQIYAVTPDGRKHWQVTNHELEAGWHDWTPDGKWLVADMSKGQKGYDIYLIRYKTQKLKRLAGSWKTEQAPAFVERRGNKKP